MWDWIAGTGVNLEAAGAGTGAGGESEDEELLDGAEDCAGHGGSQGGGAAVEVAAAGPWWVVVDSNTVEGVGRAAELGVALQTFAATVEVDRAWGDGQLAMRLGDLGG